MFYLPSSSSWVITWKRYQLTCSGWVHWVLLVVKQGEVVSLHRRENYSIILYRGHHSHTQSRKTHVGRTLIHCPQGGEKEIPHPLSPGTLHPWSIRGKLSSTQSQYHARVVRLGFGMRANTSGGESICWNSALKQLLPSPSTPASARSQDILLGSTREAPCFQKQDFAPLMPLSLQSSPWGFSPNFSRNDSKIWCHSKRNIKKGEFTNALLKHCVMH